MAKEKLGLHTQDEQAKAMDLARRAMRIARKAASDQDLEKFSFARGYVQAIMDLAVQEGAHELAADLERIMGKMMEAWT